MAPPSKGRHLRQSKVAAIDTFEGELKSAFASQAVTIRLEDEIDISRGDMLVRPDNLPHSSRRFQADVVWMSEKPLDRNKSYLLKCTTQMVRVNVESVDSVVDLETLDRHQAPTLELNDIGQLHLVCHRPIQFDPYQENRTTGAFILIDSISNNTVAAGMIVGAASSHSVSPGSLSDRPPVAGQVSNKERSDRLGQVGACLVVTGHKPDETAYAIERALYDNNRVGTVLDPSDEISSAFGEPSAAVLKQSVLRLTQVGAVALVSAKLTDAELESLKRAMPERVLALEVGDELSVDGQPLTLAGKAVSRGDLESQGRAVVALLKQRGFLLDD